MTDSYGISAIGMNPLGTLGLDYSGAYASYGDPMMTNMMAMNGMNGMSGLYGMGTMGNMGAMGMMGMYNPAFMQQYMSAQQSIEKQQVQHAQDMHSALSQTRVADRKDHDLEVLQTIIVDSDVQRQIGNLAKAVRNGDSDSVVAEYDKLKSNILMKYADQLNADSKGDTGLKVDGYIEKMYAQIVSQQTGETVSLREDIRKYGENPFENGFNTVFLGNKDHSTRYSEEALAYIDNNRRINDKGSHDRAKTWGKATAHVAEGAGAAAAGAVAGVTLLGIGKLLPAIGSKFSFVKNAKAAGWIGAGVILLGDIIWQMSRSESST